MVASQLGTNAPNGSVGVNNWLRNAENNRFTAGIIAGFTPAFDGMNIIPAGTDTLNYCQAVNANGEMQVFGINSVGPTKIALKAPTTSGQSLCYAIVAWMDATATTDKNNGAGVVQLDAVPGTATATGSEEVPTDSVIRTALANGSTAYVAVLMMVTVPYGATKLTASMVNVSKFSGVTINGQTPLVGNPFHSNILFQPYLPTFTLKTSDSVQYAAQMVGPGTDNPILAVQLEWTNAKAFTSTAWMNVELLQFEGWTASNGEVFGWLQDNNGNGETRYTSTFYCAGQVISWRDSGNHPITKGCWHNGGILIPVKPL